MLEDLKTLNDLGEAIKKGFKEVGPDAIKYVNAIRLKDVIVSGVALAFCAVIILICLPWGINLLTQDNTSPAGITLIIVSIITGIIIFGVVGCLIEEIGMLVVHWRNPKADAVDYWTDQFKN